MKRAAVLLLFICVHATAAPTFLQNATLLSGPQILTSGSLTSNTSAFLILERSQFVLPSQVTLDTLTNGITYSTFWPGTSSTLPAGTLVDVWLFHVQRSGYSLGNLTATIDFGAPILGYAGRGICGLGGACLSSTDAFGNPGSVYATGPLRGLELLISGDSIMQSSDSAVTISAITSAFFLDEVRIFTVSNPEPGTLLLTGISLFLFAARRRFR
jgi:hypothetical protein